MSRQHIDQHTFETAVRSAVEGRLAKAGTVNAMLPIELVSCDVTVPRVELLHTVGDWELNIAGSMHGGIITTLLDSTMGLLSKAYTGAPFTPTVSITVNFLRGVRAGETLHIAAEMTHAGGHILQLWASCWTDDEKAPAATAMGTFYRRPQK